MDSDSTAAPRRRYRDVGVVLTALTSVFSLVGGVTFLVFSGEVPHQPAALKPRTAPAPMAPAEPAAAAPSESGMDFPGGLSSGIDAPAAAPAQDYADYSALVPGAASAPAVPLGAPPPAAALQLPQFQPPALPPAEDLLGLVQPYVQAYIDSVVQSLGADLAESITGNALGTAANLAIGALDGLILYAAYVDNENGGRLLNQLQNALPALAAPPLAAEAAAPVPDFAGLSEAFAAVADMPLALGQQVPPQLPRAEDVVAGLALPQLPRAEDIAAGLALPQLPQLPRAEEVALGLAALPQLPPPQLPQLPQLPRAEDVAGGIVAVTVAGLVLSVIFQPPKPPSLTRMMGLPF